MNKHELKSLLENIYYTLTEADSPQYIPPYRFPLVPIQIPTTPDATPPVTTPVPPKPISPDLYQSPTLTLTPNPNRPPRPDNDPEDPEEEAENERIWRGILRDLGITPETVPGLFESNLRDNINKHELKSLLENIYTALTEEGEWHPPMLAPEENPNWSPLQPPSTKPTQPYVLPDPWWQPPPPPPTPPKPVYPPWPTDPEDERSRLRGLMIDDYDRWLEDMESDPTWWSDRYGFDVLEWWRSLNPGPEYRPGGMSG